MTGVCVVFVVLSVRTMDVGATIRIDRPITDVFAFVADVENMPRWVTGVSSATLLTERVEQGARFEVTYTSAWRPSGIVLEIVAYEPPHKIVIGSVRGPFAFHGTLELASIDGDATEVTSRIEAGPDSLSTRLLFTVAGPLLRSGMKRRLSGELDQLAVAVTGGPFRIR